MPASESLSCLFVLPDLAVGGAERVTLTLLQHLERPAFTPALFLFRHQGPFLSDRPGNLSLCSALPANAASTPLNRLRILRALFIAARQHQVLVGALELKSNFATAVIGLLARRPVISWVHKHLGYYLSSKRMPIRLAYWSGCALAFTLSRTVVAVSEDAADSIRQLFPWLGQKVVARYNPVAFSPSMTEDKEVIRSPREFLAVGRLTAQKGFDILLTAFAYAQRQRPDLRLCILGDGEERAALERQCEQLKLKDVVKMPGFQTPYPAMHRCRSFVLSSRYEGLPTVMLEAMHCGAPVISTDCHSGPAEILAQGRHGVLVPVADADALAKAMLRLAEDDALCQKLTLASRQRARDFDLSTTVSAWQGELQQARGASCK